MLGKQTSVLAFTRELVIASSLSSRKGIQAEVLIQMEEQRLNKHDPFRKHLWEREDEQDLPQSRHTGQEMPRVGPDSNGQHGKGLCKEDLASPIS